ncbi:hypothetical protein FJZ31_16105 [Candidatus Poribacteria bacterium]|nr:hypothetical protein [Candidatus Poribacteria bacterium]
MSETSRLNIKIPKAKGMHFKVELSTEFNITPFVAKQKVNRFLALKVGDLLGAAEPELTVGQGIYWRVPVRYCLPGIGKLGIVGFLAIDIDTGEVLLSISTPLEELTENAERFIIKTKQEVVQWNQELKLLTKISLYVKAKRFIRI